MSLPISHQLIGLCCGMLTLLGPARAQTSPGTTNPYSQVTIASPTAAALGKYADIPVGYHTGIPQVEVPLYTIKEGSLTLPVSLSYHAGGVKVLEPASWVGTGWALNAGGVITRSVLGTPDEKGTTANVEYGHFSNYGFSTYWTRQGSNNNPGYYGTDTLQNDNAFLTGQYDGEPDLFFFNFNGYSGKFYFSDDRTPVLIDGQDLKIEYYYPADSAPQTSGVNLNIQGFIITVPTGDKYYFGVTNATELAAAGVKPVEKSFTYMYNYSSSNDNVYTSYYLKRIVAADGLHTIAFTYEAEQYSCYSLSMFPVVGGAYRSGLPNDPREYALIKNNIDGVRVKKISFSTGAVEFNPAAAARQDVGAYGYNTQLQDIANTEAKALGDVTISSPGFCKRYTLDYSYFTDNSNTSLATGLQAPAGIVTDKYRLKLNKVTEQSCDGTIAANPWVFDYYKDATNNYFLPRRLSFAQDHWGFYNGADANNSSSCNTLIATYATSTTATGPATAEYAGANRDPAWPAMAYGILTRVTYPTGGSAQLEYEPNTVWVNYPKYTYQYPTERIVNSSNDYSYVDYTFTPGSYYRFKLDFYPVTGNGSQGCSYSNTSATVSSTSGSTTGLSVDRQTTHSERITMVNGGTFRIGLTLSNYCAGDHAQISIEEAVLTNVQQNALAGGLRIKTLNAQESAAAPALLTSYNYEDTDGHSTGTLYSRPRYVQAIRNKEIEEYGYSSYPGPGPPPEIGGCLNVSYYPSGPQLPQTYLKSPCAIMPLSTTQGNHLGYDQVTVAKAGNGRAVYSYYEYDKDANTRGKILDDVCYRRLLPGCDPSTPYLPAVPLRFEFHRGLLKNESVYAASGLLVKSTQYAYAYDSSKNVTPCRMAKYEGPGVGLIVQYERRAYYKTRAEVTETNYASNGVIWVKTSVQRYESPYHHQLSSSTETTTSGELAETRNQYVADFRVPSCDNIADGTAAYQSACAACDAAYTNNTSPCGTDYNCRRTAYWNRLLCRAAARRNYIAYRRAKFTNQPNEFQTAHDNAKANADSKLRPLLQLQDDGHNELVETSHWQNQRLLSASYTTFGPGLNQPATMYPAQQFGLYLTSPAASFTPAAVNGTTVSRDARYDPTPELALQFDRGSLVEARTRGGSLTAYLWDNTNTLPVAKATGVRYSTLRAAYVSAGGNLTTLRTAPALAGSLLQTYTHRPLVGLASQTDPTGRLLTYEYDALGRLVRTRDEQNRILGQQQYHYVGQP